MGQSLDLFCRRYGHTRLLDEWDAERNLPLTPESVSYGSHERVWWRCEQGHKWQAAIYARTNGSGCPYCAGKKVGQGNDLMSLYPELAAQWDLQKKCAAKAVGLFCGEPTPCVVAV